MPPLEQNVNCSARQLALLIRLLARFQYVLLVLRPCVFLRSCVMPSFVPDDTYIVLDDFGPLGRAWRETDEAGADRATLVRNLLEGQYENRIVAFNTAEGWSRDVTVEIADEVRRRYVEYDEASA